MSNPGPDSGILVKKKHGLALQRDELNCRPRISEPARSHLLIQIAPVPVDFAEFSWFLHRKVNLIRRINIKILIGNQGLHGLVDFLLGNILKIKLISKRPPLEAICT